MDNLEFWFIYELKIEFEIHLVYQNLIKAY